MNQDAKLPMYQQVKNYLIRKIESHEYKEGQKLLSERELSEKFQISRMTARNAILELVKEGYAYRDGARGTFVSSKKVKRNFLASAGFSDHMEKSGIEDRESRVMCFELVEADTWLSSRLSISLGTECFHLVRLRIGNGQPMAVDECYIPVNMAPTLMDHDFSKESLWKVLEHEYGHRPTQTRASIEIVSFEKREQNYLNVSERAKGFKVTYMNYDQHGEPLEYTITYYREDMFIFEYELIR